MRKLGVVALLNDVPEKRLVRGQVETMMEFYSVLNDLILPILDLVQQFSQNLVNRRYSSY